ncbi:MAG: aminotransferase class I/II-fold pyridoxal phosphate-dependent enzyme, partial [Puniceicoccales bacterium]
MVTRLSSIESRAEEQLATRATEGLSRTLTVRDASAVLDLSNNDYLRMSQHPEVIAAGQRALAKWGASASASPLISGYTAAHRDLEEQLCAWAGFPYGLVWNTGHSANQALLSLLPRSGDLVLADRLIHQSMISGLLRSGARLQRYRHLDLNHLESLLQATGEREVIVVTESVFSMDGDYPDLKQMAELKARYGFFWIVDEAHALGWYGRKGSGLVEAFDVADLVDVYVGTLGKALGSMGAFTLFRKASLRDFFINFAGEFIYSTYLAPSCAAAAGAAVSLIEAFADRENWHTRSRSLREQIKGTPAGDSPIIPVVIGDNQRTLDAANFLLSFGFQAGAVRPPTVPAGEGRLRISLNTALTERDETRLL